MDGSALVVRIKAMGMQPADFARMIGVGEWRVSEWFRSPFMILNGDYEGRVCQALQIDAETLRREIGGGHEAVSRSKRR